LQDVNEEADSGVVVAHHECDQFEMRHRGVRLLLLRRRPASISSPGHDSQMTLNSGRAQV
jgi:hypothetical protein